MSIAELIFRFAIVAGIFAGSMVLLRKYGRSRARLAEHGDGIVVSSRVQLARGVQLLLVRAGRRSFLVSSGGRVAIEPVSLDEVSPRNAPEDGTSQQDVPPGTGGILRATASQDRQGDPDVSVEASPSWGSGSASRLGASLGRYVRHALGRKASRGADESPGDALPAVPGSSGVSFAEVLASVTPAGQGSAVVTDAETGVETGVACESDLVVALPRPSAVMARALPREQGSRVSSVIFDTDPWAVEVPALPPHEPVEDPRPVAPAEPVDSPAVPRASRQKPAPGKTPASAVAEGQPGRGARAPRSKSASAAAPRETRSNTPKTPKTPPASRAKAAPRARKAPSPRVASLSVTEVVIPRLPASTPSDPVTPSATLLPQAADVHKALVTIPSQELGRA